MEFRTSMVSYVDWEEARIVDREANQRLRQVKEDLMISLSPCVVNVTSCAF